MRSRVRAKSLTPVITMMLLFLALTAFGLVQTMREMDELGNARTERAVAAIVESKVRQMTALAEDNALWDDAARNVYGGLKDEEFLWSSWGSASAEGKNYDTVLILDHARAPLVAFRQGRAARLDPDRYGAGFSALLNTLTKQREPVGGIISSPDGAAFASAAFVMPTSRALDRIVPAGGPAIIIFTKPFDQKAAGEIGEMLLLDDTRIIPDLNTASLVVADAAGKPVFGLSWTPLNLGFEVFVRTLPLIAFGVFLLIVIAILVERHASRSIGYLADQALVDSLSKLPNRRALRATMTRKLDQQEPIALAMIDLDGFKAINDLYGHSVGDRLIKAVAEILKAIAHENAMIARLGGDEFAIMLSGKEPAARIEYAARDLLSHLSRPFRIDERTVVVGASIGLAAAGAGRLDASELMRRADVAMYSAKRAGKMRLAWYDELLDQKQAAARMLEAELRAAIEAESFTLAYQPVVDTGNQKVAAVEALLRWESPSRGRVDPAEFIAVAEETGLIDRIGMLALRRACADALAWGDLGLAVNVASAQLRNPSFAQDVAAVLAETGFPATRLELELTESFLVYDAEMAKRVLSDIRALGVSLALDDFGSGVAAVGHLRQFPFAKVKIDRTLVNSACNNVASRTILQAGISVARALGMTIAAQGVETGEHRDLMRVAGCDLMQGWLYSRPGSAEDIAARIAHDYPEAEAEAASA